jgi:hypothetical protein
MKNALQVIIKYAGAGKPFRDDDASPSEQLASVKARAMTAFKLADGQTTPDGNTIAYKLYHGKDELTNMTQTLADIAGSSHAIELKLSQYVEQGG